MRLKAKDLANFWPIGVAIALIPVQADLLIVSSAWHQLLGIGLPFAVFIVQIIAAAKMFWTYWFWRWVRDLVADSAKFRRLVELVRRAAYLVRQEGLVDLATAEFKIRHDRAHNRGRRLLKIGRRAACITLFCSGASPWIGFRGPWAVVLGLTKFRAGLYALALGGAVRIVYMMVGVAALIGIFTN